MINAISHQLAKAFSEFIDRKNEVDYIRYGIEIILNGIIKLLVLLGIAYIVGLFQPMVWVLFTFIFFRSFTGGHHYSTYFRCLVAGLIGMLSLSYLAVRLASFISYLNLITLLIVSLILSLLLTYKYAPSNHFYKKSSNRQKKKLRNYSIVLLFFWGLFMYFLITISYSTELLLASIFGLLFQICSIHPLSYLFVNKVEKFLERGK